LFYFILHLLGVLLDLVDILLDLVDILLDLFYFILHLLGVLLDLVDILLDLVDAHHLLVVVLQVCQFVSVVIEELTFFVASDEDDQVRLGEVLELDVLCSEQDL